MENITFEDFQKMDLRVAEIKSCEDIEGADKLYKLTIDVAEERYIVAGIKQHYTREELVGKKIVIVANLEPRKLRGTISHGMLLAATGADGVPVILMPEKDVEEGAKIK